jgi:membrane protease YdiL (CAAX protease family)
MVFGFLEHSRWAQLLTVVIFLLPWFAVLISRASPGWLGYKRERFFLHLGWGMVAGGIWRVLSILLNLAHLNLSGVGDTPYQLLIMLVWVPLIEETFFRGYIGQSLSRAWGTTPGVVIQAAAFVLLPAHTTQGGWNMLSIFLFGLLAGWLMETRRSIWAPWGAHAFANVLPYLALAVN